MSNLEKYTELKELIDRYSKYTFSLLKFDRDKITVTEHRNRTDKPYRDLDDGFIKWIEAGLSRTEHIGSSEITYHGGYAFGNALKDVALREMNIALLEYAKLAKDEAESCLQTLKNQ